MRAKGSKSPINMNQRQPHSKNSMLENNYIKNLTLKSKSSEKLTFELTTYDRNATTRTAVALKETKWQFVLFHHRLYAGG